MDVPQVKTNTPTPGGAFRTGARTGLAALGRGWHALWEQVGCAAANLRRSLLRKHLPDYPVIVLDQALSERAPDLPWYYAYLPGVRSPLSLESLHHALHRIAGDPDVRGVVFLFKGPTLGLAQAQSLTALFARFHRWDAQLRPAGVPPKQIVVHLEQASPAAYLVAAAADKVTMPPLASWDLLGLRVAPTYYQETLARIGVEWEVVKVAPWKTAADRFARREMSAAERDQYNWLLDSFLEDIVGALAQGRQLPADQVRALLDRAPLTPEEALAAGLIDHIAYEDQLAELLGTPTAPARLKPYAQMRKLLLRRPQPQPSGQVGVLSLRGTMIVGNSRSFPLPLPLLGEDLMGSTTVEQLIRAARRDDRLKAVVLHIDSGGGSALASDLIWRELCLLDQEKPLIVYLGDAAASGGYYIATPGRRIVAQSATLTGSIGVVVSKPVTAGLIAKIGANREVIRRGDNAGIYGDDAPWTPAQRARIEATVDQIYATFKARVTAGRNLSAAALEDIAGGRVWTGKQALVLGLVDELGDFDTALRAACRAAGLPEDDTVKTVPVTTPGRRLLAEPVKPPQTRGLAAWTAALVQGEWAQIVARDPIWLIDPDLPRIE